MIGMTGGSDNALNMVYWEFGKTTLGGILEMRMEALGVVVLY